MASDLKVSSSQAKIYENFVFSFFKSKANNKCFKLLKCTCKGLQKKQVRRAVKSKPKALRHFKVDPILKTDQTFFKQAESMLYKACKSLNVQLIQRVKR